MYNVGSLYSGVGGFEKAFSYFNNYQIIWSIEQDKWAVKTFKNNFNTKIISKDIFNVDIKSLEQIDVLCAGFPCQPFSIAGIQRGFLDFRGNHFFKILHFLKILKPKIIILENVKNLISHDNYNTFRTIRKLLKKHGYYIKYKVLNTKIYSNIPQNRERIFIVGFLNKKEYKKFKFPNKSNKLKSMYRFIQTSVDKKYFYTKKFKYYAKLVSEIKNKNTFYQWRRKYIRENKNNVCPTLTANMGTGGHNIPIILTDLGIRKLTPLECFKLQGFRNFNLPNDVSDSQLYKQAGNSITVDIVVKLIKQIDIARKNHYDAQL